MDVDFSRLPTGTSGWLALIDHALTLGDLSEVDWLELKGALPFGTKSERKRSAVVLTRAMLGLANRMPDVAAKHLGGSGVVLAGVDGQAVTSVKRAVVAERVDGAVLHDALQPYVGNDGPNWDYVFIDHPSGLVMAVVVEPPRWGDRIHACRRDYSDADGTLTVRDGDVFVRVPGKTRPATSHDLAELERRRDRSPDGGAQVSVEYSDRFDRVDSASVKDLVAEGVERKAEALFDGFSARSRNSGPYSIKVPSVLGPEDQRSAEEFRRAVTEWRAESLSKCDLVATEFLRHELARGKLSIRNESDRYLEAVRAQIQFPRGVVALMASDTDYCHHGGAFNPFALLPERPKEWGTQSPYDFARIAVPNLGRIAATPQVTLPTDFEVEESDHGGDRDMGRG